MFKRHKSTNGITLVALVVTIIILLILAGITISQLTGSGLFERAREAREKTEQAEKDENDKLLEYEDEIIKYLIGERNNVDYTDYNDNLKLLYTNAEKVTKFKLPTTIKELVSSKNIFDWVLQSKENVDYIIANSDIFMNEIVNSEVAMTCIGKNEYAGYKVITDENYRDNILNSSYISYFDNESTQIPTLTDNTNVRYFSQHDETYAAYKAFDKNPSTWWCEALPHDDEEYIEYDFKENVVPYKIEIYNILSSNIYRCKTFYIQGTTDNINYTNLTTNMTAEKNSEKQTFIIENFKTCQSIRMNIIDRYPYSGAWGRGVGELQIYCRKVPN